jgi:dihydrofolate synthase/folylpolyglutamate synthase
MNYQETLQFLFAQLPMFQRIGAAAYKADLDNTLALCKMLGNPERQFPSIHIAGTNGKGSTSNMLASVFQEAGYKTGLYTSPHLLDFRERIRVNGKMVPQDFVVDFVEEYRNRFIHIKPSFFEITFAMAIEYFRQQGVEMAIIETGMGGRLDSTNVVKSVLSIITNIGLDHTAFLGDTLEKIAAEKAGIMKPGVPVIIGEYQEEVASVFLQKAKSLPCDISWANKRLAVTLSSDKGVPTQIFLDNQAFISIDFPLKGKYQQKNLLSVMAAILYLKTNWRLSKEVIIRGLENVVENTSFAGRWQILHEKPLVIADTGHNEDGLRLSMQQLAENQYQHLHFVLGMVNDKAVDKVLQLLPSNAHFYFCQAKIPRALEVSVLTKQAIALGLNGIAYSSVETAFSTALQKADPKDLIFVGGSTFVVAEALEYWNQINSTKINNQQSAD